MASPHNALARRSAVTHTGDMTWYDVGVGSCGSVSSPGEYVVALSPVHMGSVPNPNLAPICGSTITIEFEGQAVQATVLDTCPTCEANAIDCSSSLFQAVAPHGDGRVVVDWRFNDDGGDSSAPASASQAATLLSDEVAIQQPSPVSAGPGPAVIASPSCTTSELSTADKAVGSEPFSSVTMTVLSSTSTEDFIAVPSRTTSSTERSSSWQSPVTTIATAVPSISTISVASTVTPIATPRNVTASETAITTPPPVLATISSIDVETIAQESTVELTQPPPTAIAMSEAPVSNWLAQAATTSSRTISMWPVVNGTASTTPSFIKTTPVPNMKSSPTPYTGKARAPGIAKAMGILLLALPIVAAML